MVYKQCRAESQPAKRMRISTIKVCVPQYKTVNIPKK